MSSAEKAPFEARAAEEQGFREEACMQPFVAPESGAAAFNAVEHLHRNSLKKVSRHRAFESYVSFRGCDHWQYHDAGICSFDGAINLDLIDLDPPDVEIAEKWATFARATPDPQDFVPPDNTSIHHSTCHKDFGVCKRHLKKEVSFMVHSLSKHLESGDLPLRDCEGGNG